MILTIFLLTLAIGLLALWHIGAYARHSRTTTAGGHTGAGSGHEILRQAGIIYVAFVEFEELLGDHYDQRHRRLVVPTQSYPGRWAAADVRAACSFDGANSIRKVSNCG